ncbi:hypothetical protein [Brevifollis gellanilyticus]|uniref:hypothetical protein n=1 Tax=Brevifollis gellanilyticus TaxID=748831 RepID=UPI00147875E1|nr:hypothetical protein [Brevifollis gellanilyticus]
MRILVEPEINLRKEEDVYWLLDLVVEALRENHEEDFSTEVVLTSAPAKSGPHLPSFY